MHLAALEAELIAAGIPETARGALWSKNCREWVYFDVVLDLEALTNRFGFDPCVNTHQNLDSRSGLESGFVCTRCDDAVVGRLSGAPRYA
ncbi:hypothetical protein [Phytoactinopolyspora limicola]|uniref:hypothetical protein n=1 Tax=Phytoactinopolyspora limicola TaxID=2715536 RepID=UPI00140E53ED|nr:hypothetical protein [Phytoactinopolyspora limicola]